MVTITLEIGSSLVPFRDYLMGFFRKVGVPYFDVLTVRILLFRVLYWGPLFSETPF